MQHYKKSPLKMLSAMAITLPIIKVATYTKRYRKINSQHFDLKNLLHINCHLTPKKSPKALHL